MVYKNREEKNINPLLRIIQTEYRVVNIFLIIFSIFYMGFFCDLIHSYPENSSLYKIGLILDVIVFLFGLFPFIKKIIQNVHLVSFPTKKQIIIKIIQVFIFMIILILFLNFCQYFYENHIINLKKYIQ
ncbi:preprotein translocase subunit SecE [Candidatus Phytoplasma melaleucae]|uniref:Preprotein translocase subunit SecE n=1 Tax=Candidatus Phytoplasma melaleucae TaxID=2982630 RepID=A0ABT9DDT0_9MOLU|nr:preprotein translocase subunit SecE ['Melaleuca sp.' phytoplasma]MDO8168185.1 preprotein translocase subunit SecE ['Melaleuca sp.' phytoplasma]MDV3205421.1 preprotein translocase subunit SecE [Weeping tea tree witches'-broom phytoplasma]